MANCQLSIVNCKCLAIIAWALLVNSARADLDPEFEKPYRIQIVLHVAPNRFLTKIFQDQVHSAVRDQIEQALGTLARVEVISAPLPQEIQAKGLEGGLASVEQLSGVQTHFVLVDCSGGVYTVKTRYYDGMTGLVSPSVRTVRTADRAQVPRLAATLVEENFGLVATVLAGKEIQLAIKGSKLADVQRWAAPGQIFAISKITREADRLHGRRVNWALLEVLEAPRQGVCKCRLWRRYAQDDLQPQPGVEGYRCLRLAVATGPVTMQFLDEKTLQPLALMPVRIRKPWSKQADEEATTDRSGTMRSKSAYHGFVLVEALPGGAPTATIPVPITGAEATVCRISPQAGADSRIYLELRRDQWIRRILDNLLVARERALQMNDELAKSMPRTLEIARPALKSMQGETEYLKQEHDLILREAKEKAAKLDLRDGELALQSLVAKADELATRITKLEELIADASSPETIATKKTIERAGLLESEAAFDEAIALYEKVLQARPGENKVREHLTKLKEAWAIKSEVHGKARTFLVNDWPKLGALELLKNMDTADKSLAVCKEVGDKLTPLRLIQANIAHASSLGKQKEALARQDSVENRAQIEVIRQTADRLRRLHAEAKLAAGKKD